MGFLRVAFEQLVLLFFITHIPITILVDSQAIFPREHYPQFAQKMLDDFIRDFKDPLMTPLQPWFKSFVYSEIFFQLPVFFIGAYAFAKRTNTHWIRMLLIIYGSFVVASMVPILTVLATHTQKGYNPLPVVGFYLPYLIFPASIVLYLARSNIPFSSTGSSSSRKSTKSKRR